MSRLKRYLERYLAPEAGGLDERRRPSGARSVGGARARARSPAGDGTACCAVSISMRTLPALLLLGALVCGGYGVWYKREFRAINRQLKAMPGVTVLATGGIPDFAFESIYADLELAGQRRLTLTDLTIGAFSGAEPFSVSRVGELAPRITSYGFMGIRNARTGRPEKSFWRIHAVRMGDPELGKAVCCAEYDSIPEVIAAFDQLERRLQAWPRCPDFLETTGNDGTVYRYCATAPDTYTDSATPVDWSPFNWWPAGGR